MSAGDIEGIRRLLVAKPRPTTLAERRERLDEIGSAFAVAADIRFEATHIGGVEAEWSATPPACWCTSTAAATARDRSAAIAGWPPKLAVLPA
jgi:hypothetical protein